MFIKYGSQSVALDPHLSHSRKEDNDLKSAPQRPF